MQKYDVDCQGDEFPPAVIWQGRDRRSGQAWIRQLEGSQNTGAGNIFRGVCDDPPLSRLTRSGFLSRKVGLCATTSTFSVTKIITWKALILNFTPFVFPPGDPDGLHANECWPSSLIEDPGWALLTNDKWYNEHLASRQAIAGGMYAVPPPAHVTAGKSRREHWNKRDLSITGGDAFDPDDVFIIDANSTRKATDEELRDQLGFRRCADAECSAELEEFGIESAIVMGVPKTMPATVAVTSTTIEPVSTSTLSSVSDSRMTTEVFPQITEMPTAPKRKSNEQMQKELRELLNRAVGARP